MIEVYYNNRRVIFIDKTPELSTYNEETQRIRIESTDTTIALPTNTVIYNKSYQDLAAAKADLNLDFSQFEEDE